MSKHIGFIGLGIMGKPMAKNLVKAGYHLQLYDINPAAVKEIVDMGADESGSPMDAANEMDVIITMLPNSSHVRQVALGDRGIVKGARPGTIYIDMSSINPIVTREVANNMEEKGIPMLDAPVSGGESKAADGTLSIMAGGPEQAFDQVLEILRCMGSSVIRIGEVGSGNVAKLVNQMIVILNLAAVSEAMTLAVMAKVDPETIYNAIKNGAAGGNVLNTKLPMMLARNFKPGFKIDLMIKDIMNAAEFADSLNAPFLLTGLALEILKVLKGKGKGSLDHAGIVQFYEMLSGIEVKSSRYMPNET